MYPNDSVIRDLGSNADHFDRVLPLVLFDLRYAFASGRQLYFGTRRESGGPPGLALGAVLPFEDGSELDVAVFAARAQAHRNRMP